MPESVSFITGGVLITEDNFFQYISQALAVIPKVITYIGTHHSMRQTLPFQNAIRYAFALDSATPLTVAAAPWCTEKNIEELISQYPYDIEHVHVFFDDLVDNNATHPCTYVYTFYVLIV